MWIWIEISIVLFNSLEFFEQANIDFQVKCYVLNIYDWEI